MEKRIIRIDWFDLMEMGIIDTFNDYVCDELGEGENFWERLDGYTLIGVEGREILFQVELKEQK